MKKYVSNAKEKNMEPFGTKIEKNAPRNISKDYKPKKIVGALRDNYI